MTLYERFVAAFIASDRWKLYISGVGITLEIALFAGILGMLIGNVVALMKLSQTEDGKPTILNYIATFYVDIIRGTPSVLQLLIMWFIIMASSNNGILVASLSFGINSGAYVSEIVRAGILAVDKGQMEAGRSLGLSKAATMYHIILPQAIKNIIPPLGNEFITLIKETAIVGYVSLSDLTRVANQVASRTYDAFMPLIGAAVIYFIIIKILTILLGVIERRLRKVDNR
ncbi:amino acid ABC transporter permease [Butyrivibrio sp. YAB3001]|uniref:amino acid ABC transporter permease n=1 Tax=Butyrivibrio sp. YAB3001 TaxID=1520812 RepID=UPI0008F64ADF|nr:amino acid ABC transporter permease [Butyrivibrio sp. YAB3001]SFB68162.1 polar amino acid transport system permease protein [Butyrivibrio sp. YAB3001]